jgi:hypothetical protein
MIVPRKFLLKAIEAGLPAKKPITHWPEISLKNLGFLMSVIEFNQDDILIIGDASLGISIGLSTLPTVQSCRVYETDSTIHRFQSTLLNSVDSTILQTLQPLSTLHQNLQESNTIIFWDTAFQIPDRDFHNILLSFEDSLLSGTTLIFQHSSAQSYEESLQKGLIPCSYRGWKKRFGFPIFSIQSTLGLHSSISCKSWSSHLDPNQTISILSTG